MRTFKHSLSLLHVDHVKLDKRWNFKNIISPYYRIYYIHDGEGWLWDTKSKVYLEPGFLYMIPSFTLCNMKCDNHLAQYFVQFFEDSTNGLSLFANNRSLIKEKATEWDIENFKRLLAINPSRGIKRSNNPKIYEKSIYYREYQQLNNAQSQSEYFETQGILFQLLSKFIPLGNSHDNKSIVPSKIMETVNYIHLNLNKNLTVGLLAKEAGYHPDYFSRVFERYTGDRPIAYINEKRIERAQYLITTTVKSLEEIASETGFDGMAYFFRTFRRFTGITPTKYRLQTKVDIII
ncbi:AraC family transcriptional regulator [Pedobacter sp. BMA]|uniref:helix-turn-helix domain-containing protein n=1 Tax=Pedobacter sp. BMA TaxID=1663685 RepID=UPI00064B49DC|nr:AraC family transcriptional regulator [Pedobacter sp. BMA]KLT67148.1 regulator [Pedobacter sp. BMA]